jgi:hypothetical protein
MAADDNYGEPAAPPQRADRALVALVVLGVAVLVACFLWNRLAPSTT